MSAAHVIRLPAWSLPRVRFKRPRWPRGNRGFLVLMVFWLVALVWDTLGAVGVGDGMPHVFNIGNVPVAVDAVLDAVWLAITGNWWWRSRDDDDGPRAT